MKCIVAGGGNLPSEDTFRKAIIDADYFIAADKGADIFYRYGIVPNLIMGDFDSVDKNVSNAFSEIESIRFLPEKDDTDSVIAVKKAIELGATDIVLIGMTGTRLDHTFANIGLLKMCIDKNVNCIIIDDNNCISAYNKSFSIIDKGYKYFSLLSYCDVVKDLSIKNAKYELESYNLKMGDSLTVSNELIDNEAYISFKEGIIILIQSND